MNLEEESSAPSVPSSQPGEGTSDTVVNQVFSLFKDYLQDQLETKTKEIEQKSRVDKEVVQLKFKGNQKQFELNAEIDSILEIIETESQRAQPNQERIQKLAKDGRLLIRKRQKLIKIADKSKDGWQVVAEYESDELASGSDDEKRLKKAREAAGRKRRQKEQAVGERPKKQRCGSSPDNQLFRGKVLFLERLVYFVFHNDLDPLAYPTIFLVCLIVYGDLSVKLFTFGCPPPLTYLRNS